MKENALIKKYLVWMILYNDSKPLSLLEIQRTYDGKTCLYSYVPLVDITVQGIDKDIKIAFRSFFETFNETIEGYMKYWPDVEKAFRKQFRKTNLKKIYRELEKENIMLKSILEDFEKAFNEEGPVGKA